MMNRLGRFLVLLCFVVFGASSLFASEEEYLWGFYQSTNKKFDLQFVIGQNGVSNVKVNSVEYPGTFRVTEHGIFGNTAFYQIHLKVGPERVEYICLLIFFDRRGVYLASGYYADLRFPDSEDKTKFNVKAMEALEMKVETFAKQ